MTDLPTSEIWELKNDFPQGLKPTRIHTMRHS